MDKHTAVAHAVKIKSSWLQQSLGEEFATTRAKELNSARNNYFFFMLILDAGGRAAMQRRRPAGGNKTLQ